MTSKSGGIFKTYVEAGGPYKIEAPPIDPHLSALVLKCIRYNRVTIYIPIGMTNEEWNKALSYGVQTSAVK